ncbi:hypothetical protein A9Q81_07325 [Gammaproteobacteria bacterium 42_54_T18]|nr:hypothetical protein A9Q81_07325 [Gammaproteobacteria bacterium 42_54_T18]
MIPVMSKSKGAHHEHYLAGFTLVEVMIWIAALTLLALVLSAPQKNMDDLRRSALTISRVHDIVVTAQLYREFVGQWPKNGGCIILGAGTAGESLYDGYRVNPVTGWGGEIDVSCGNKDSDYIVSYNVPKVWSDMFVTYLESTKVESTSGDLRRIETTINKYGNLGKLIYFSNNELSSQDDDDEFNEAVVDDECSGFSKEVLYSPKATCFYELDDGLDAKGIRTLYNESGGFVSVSRMVYNPLAETEIEKYLKQAVFSECDRKNNGTRKKVNIKTLVQCGIE